MNQETNTLAKRGDKRYQPCINVTLRYKIALEKYIKIDAIIC